MNFIEQIKNRAKDQIKTIILPEAEDLRVLKATEMVEKEGFAKIILIGNKEQIEQDLKENNIELKETKIIDIKASDKKEFYAQKLYELRKEKGLTLEEASNLINEPIYYGMMMLKEKEADGLVSGAAHSTSNTLRPALQILKTAPNTKLVSAFFVMCVPNCNYGENGTFIFADSGLNQNPTAEELSEIAISSAKSFESLVGKQAKVAMLSYSTMGSAKSELTQKVIDATKLVKEKAPNLCVDGELQLDAAIIPEISKSKAPRKSN